MYYEMHALTTPKFMKYFSIKNSLVAALTGLALSSSYAATIASQDFGATNFPSDLNLDNGTITTTVDHQGSGASGTDLGFTANGIVSTSAGGVFAVANGEVTFTHFSGSSDVSLHSTAENASGASTLSFSSGTNYTAFFYTQVVDLSGLQSKSFSMDVGDAVGAINDVEGDIVVRLWVIIAQRSYW